MGKKIDIYIGFYYIVFNDFMLQGIIIKGFFLLVNIKNFFSVYSFQVFSMFLFFIFKRVGEDKRLSKKVRVLGRVISKLVDQGQFGLGYSRRQLVIVMLERVGMRVLVTQLEVRRLGRLKQNAVFQSLRYRRFSLGVFKVVVFQVSILIVLFFFFGFSRF